MKIKKLKFKTKVTAPTSKSHLERLLVCALLSDKPTKISFDGVISDDISAFFDCLEGLGAEVTHEGTVINVTPPKAFPEFARINCLSSGAAFRFFLPLCCALCSHARLRISRELANRPIEPLIETLRDNGCEIRKNYGGEQFPESCELEVLGGIKNTCFSVPGDVSSQFISGLLFACAVTGGEIQATGKTESLSYILLTRQVLSDFGGKITQQGDRYLSEKSVPLKTRGEYIAQGDWSNAAFALVGGAIGENPVRVENLNYRQEQGDKKIIDVLKTMGADIKVEENAVTVYPSRLKGTFIDGSDIPDIVMPLCVAGVCAEGTTKIGNVSRLRYKETDRIDSVTALISALGGNIRYENGVLTLVEGRLHGGAVEGRNDHRTVMTAALCSLVCAEEISVTHQWAVNKSYPKFFEQFEKEE